MKTEITMSPEELEEIKTEEFIRGKDFGRISIVSHLRWIMCSPSSPDTMVFKDDLDQKKYYEIRAALRGLPRP